MSAKLSVASVCRSLPNPGDESSGVFVYRRLQAMSRLARVQAVQPINFFPLIKPMPDWSRLPERQEGELEIIHAPMFYLPGVLKSLDGLWLYRAIKKKLSALNSFRGIDVVDAHFGYPEGVGALIAARRLNIPTVVTLRGFEAEYLEKPLISPQIRKVLRRADGLICVSNFLRELALRHGAQPERIRVIHNAVDRATFLPSDKSTARRGLGLPEEVPIVVSVGHLVIRKRHHVLIEAFAELVRTSPDATLLIIGGRSFETDYPGTLENLVLELGLQESVKFLGNIPAKDVARYYHAADIFALGTQREGCCNAVLESLACGVPVITTPVGDNEYFVNDDRNGYIVPVDDVGAMAKAIIDAIDRRDWDPVKISNDLAAGEWDAVAADVLEFFSETIRNSTRCK